MQDGDPPTRRARYVRACSGAGPLGAALLALAAVLAAGVVERWLRARGAARSSRAVALGLGRCASHQGLCVGPAACGSAPCVDVTGLTALVASARAHDAAAAFSPTLAWNGAGYGVAWVTAREEALDLWFARLAPEGRRLAPPTRITERESVKVLPRLAWTGSGYALAWTEVLEDGIEVRLQWLSAEGSPRGEALRVSDAQGLDFASAAVWNGREVAVAWYHAELATQMSVRLARFAPGGGRVGVTRVLHKNFLAGGTLDLAFTGDAYGVVWNSYVPRDEASTTYFVRAGAGGEGSAPLRVASGRGRHGSSTAAWNGAHFGLAWEDDFDLDDEADPRCALAFAGVTPTAVVFPRRALTDRAALAIQPRLAWSGAGYGLAWTDSRFGGLAVRFARLAVSGALAGTPLRVTTGALALQPDLVWTGREYGLAWTDTRHQALDIYFARVTSEGERAGDEVRVTAPLPARAFAADRPSPRAP